MDALGFAALVITGFASCAEFGSYALVHPVVRRLPPEHHVRVEQGLLLTFGRVMPVLLALSVALSLALALRSGGLVGWASAAAFLAALASTLVFNVPINAATARWDPEHLPPGWKEVRDRWERFQAVRSWLLLAGFVLLCLGLTLGR